MLQRFKKAITWIVLASMLLTNSIPSSMALADEYAEGSGYEQTVEESTPETVTEPAGENQGGSAPVEQTEDPSTPENASSGDQNNADASKNQQDATPAVTENGNEPTQTEGTPATTTEGEAQNTEGTEGKTPDATEGDGVTEQPAEDVKKEEEPTGETQPAETPVEESKQEEPKQENNPGQEETKTEEPKTEETPSQTSDTPSATGSQTPTESSTPAESSTATESSAPVEESKVEGPVSDDTADVETAEDWAASVQSVPITGDWGKDLVATAKSQLGYTESTKNFRIDADGTVRGYNRYAAWAGVSPYEDWCTLFILFSMRYAEIPDGTLPIDGVFGVDTWVKNLNDVKALQEPGAYQPKEGDLVFFVDEEELAATGNRVAGHVGIVSSVSTDEAGNVTSFYAIEGNNNNAVRQVSYGITDTKIFGFGVMPENPALKAEEPAAEEPAKAEEPAVQPEVQEEPKLQKKMLLKAAPPLRAEADGEGEEDPNKWPKPLKDRADGYYGVNGQSGTKEKIHVFVSGPSKEEGDDDLTYKAGQTVVYTVSYGLDQADNWPDEPYSGTMSMYDYYHDISVQIKLPAGLILTGAGKSYHFEANPNNNDPSVEHTYTIFIPSNKDYEHDYADIPVPSADTSSETIKLQVFIGNNGGVEAIHNYALKDMATVSAKWDVVNKLLNEDDPQYIVSTYTQTAKQNGTGFSTVSPDVWNVKKSVESASFNSKTNKVTFIWRVDVGLKDGENLVTDKAKYTRAGADAVNSLDLTDLLSAKLSKDGSTINPTSVTMKIDGSSDAVDVKDLLAQGSTILVWNNGDTQPLPYPELELNKEKVLDGNGDKIADTFTPVFTSYLVTAEYSVTSDMIASFADNTVYNISSDNTVDLNAELAKKEDQEGHAEATEQVPLVADSPAKIEIKKWLIPAKGSKIEYNNQYGEITYSLSSTDGESITVYQYNGTKYEPIENGTGTSVEVTTGKTYYVEAGRVYKVTETIDPAHENDMQPVNGLNYVESPQALKNDELWTAELNNKERRGQIEVTKVDVDHPTVKLANATFRLTKPDGTYVDKKTPTSGVVTFDDLPYGTYILDELTPPPGYSVDKAANGLPKPIVIGEGDGQSTDYSITVKDKEVRAHITLKKYIGTQQAYTGDDSVDTKSFTAVTSKDFPAEFVLQWTTVANPSEDDWTDATDYLGNVITNKSLNSGSLTLDVLAKDNNNQQLYYRFKETITANEDGTYPYYPVNDSSTNIAYSKTVSLSEGESATVYMYNRKYVTIKVYKNTYNYNNSGTATIVHGVSVPVTLWRYSGDTAPTSPDQLEKVGETLDAYQSGGTTETEAIWMNLPLFDEDGHAYSYYVEEHSDDNYDLGSVDTTQQGDSIVTIGTKKYVKFNLSSEKTTYTALLNNFLQAIPVRILKYNALDGNYGLSGCKIAVYTNPECTEYAKDAITGEELKSVVIETGNSGKTTIYLKGNATYYYKEIDTNGYYFVSVTSDGTPSVVTDQNTPGVINLSGVEVPSDLGNVKYKSYTVSNKPDPNVKITKTNMVTSELVKGAKFTVYYKENGVYKKYPNDTKPIVYDMTSANNKSNRLPVGTYYIAETTVPANYLNPNSVAGCAEYNALAQQYGRNISYTYDPATGLTFTEINVSETNKDFTFYNIYNLGSLKVQKTVFGKDQKTKGFNVVVKKSDGTVVKSAKTDSNGIASFNDLPIYNADGTKIVYTIEEGDSSTWNTGLSDQYYSVDSPQQATLTSGATTTTDTTGVKLTVENEPYIKVSGTKSRQNGYMATHGASFTYKMDGVTIGLYRRVAGEDNWTLIDQANTANGGNVSFDKLRRTDDEGHSYEYALVELNSNSDVYLPYKNGQFKETPSDTSSISNAALLRDYNYLLLSAETITQKTNVYPMGDMLNSSHWVQFHVTKYLDDESRAQNLKNHPESSDSSGHRTLIDDEDRKKPLDDCVFSLYRFVVPAGQTSVVFSRDTWTYLGSYTSGSLVKPDGTICPGEFLTVVDEGITDENGNVISSVNEQYVYLLVEENTGPNAVIINPHFKYLFWHTRDNNVSVSNISEYQNYTYELDRTNDGEVLNSYDTAPGTGNIMLGLLRFTKWWYDEAEHKYYPLENAYFELTLNDGTVIDQMTAFRGVDPKTDYSFAVSGTFALALGTGENEGKYYLRQYEAENTTTYKEYEVECKKIEDSASRVVYGVPVILHEKSAPEGYGFTLKGYETYLIFVDNAPGSTGNKFRFINDLYFVTSATAEVDRAENQNARYYYAVNGTAGQPATIISDHGQLRIVDYRTTNIPASVHKVGYVPNASSDPEKRTLNLDSETIATKAQYNSVPLYNVTMILERKNDSGQWVAWDADADNWKTSGDYEFSTNDNGDFFFPHGLPKGEYRIKETSLGANSKYENAYPGTDNRYRTFTVGPVPVTVYMANPEKISLTILKKDMVTDSAVSGVTFSLSGAADVTAVESNSASGTYTFANIETGTYVLAETSTSSATVSSKYFIDWFKENYSSLADLVDSEKGMKLGYDYSVVNGDVQITAVTPWDQEHNQVITLEVKNPELSKIRFVKKELGSDKTLNATFNVYYMPFSKVSGDIIVTLPQAGADSTATNAAYSAQDSGWISKESRSTGSKGYFDLDKLEPGVYAFIESAVPEGHDPLMDANGRLVVYTAVVKGGLPVNVTVNPSSVSVKGYTDPIPTSFTSGTADNEGIVLTAVAQNPEKATLRVKKNPVYGDLGDYPRDIGKWSVTLNLYEKVFVDNKETFKLIGHADIAKGNTGEIDFVDASGKKAYFTVDKTYYLEEVVNGTDGNADAAHFVWTSYKIGNQTINVTPGSKYEITVDSVEGFTIEVTNQYLYGVAYFRKYDINKTMVLHGAKFKVQYLDGNTWKDLGTATVEETKDQQGQPTGIYKAFIPLVDKNSINYKIVEVMPPDGYVMSPDPTQIEIPFEMDSTHNYISIELDKFIRNAEGSELTIYKMNNIYGSRDVDYADPDSARFAFYHYNTFKNAWELLEDQLVSTKEETVAGQTVEVTKVTYLMMPYERYAVAESYVDPANFSGLDGFFWNNVKQTMTTITVDGKEVSVVEFTGEQSVNEIKLYAYNIPYIQPSIVKVDVGGYPENVTPLMKYNIYEVSADFVATPESVKNLVDTCTNTNTETLPRLVVKDKWTQTATTWFDPDNIESPEYKGTKQIWADTNNPENRWDPTKTYILVETEVGTRDTGVTYDTMVKNDPRVRWYLKIDPVENPKKSEPPVFVLKNINSVADVELDKYVVDKDHDSLSDVIYDSVNDEYYVDSLLKGERKVVYTLKPTVTGMNQMLEEFYIVDNGLTNVEYDINTLIIGDAEQSIPSELGLTTASIHAHVTFLDKNGQIIQVNGSNFVDVDVSKGKSDEDRTINAPTGAHSFRIDYLSPEIDSVSDTYVLGDQFRPASTTIYATIKAIPNGSPAEPAHEILSFDNTATVALTYPKWGADGSGPVSVTEDDDAEALVLVKSIELPFVTINKKIITDENQQFIKVPCPITYVITVSNNKNSTVNFVNPVVLDILPTGVTYDPDYDPVVSTGTSGEDINMASITPIRGEMVQKVKMPDGVTYDFADPETAVVFRISGSLQPGSSFTITFKAKASASATLYEVPGEQTKIQNDVYLSSSVHSYYTEGNINGYSFAVSKGTDGYNFGQSLENSASGNGVSAIHESGVHGDLTDPENSDTNYTGTEYSWIHGNVDIGVIGADRLTLSKAVYGDRDEGFHSSGLGVATRTNSTPGKVSNGWVKWRLEVYNGDDEVAEKLVMGDVIPKVGDDPNERHSRWDVIFDQIETVKVNGTATDKYSIYYYTKDVGLAQNALIAALPNVRNWVQPDDGWTATLPSDKSTITAFMIVFDESVSVQVQHSAVVTYHSVVKDYPDDTDFNENRAFQNATNLFSAFYSGYPGTYTSRAVSVTLLDELVEIQGDVWIDEDWDNKQQENHNRRDYSKYEIVNGLSNAFVFRIRDMRIAAGGVITSEDSDHGTNSNPGYGESIRHFQFKKLNPAHQINTPIYITKDGYRDQVLNAWGNMKALKGDDPFFYELLAEMSSAYSENVKLTGLLPITQNSGHFMSDNPDTELTASAPNSLDNNFYPDGEGYKTNPFYIRYSNDVDQSKDIGFRMYRELQITKVAQDNTSLKLEGAEFQIYGPYDDTYSTETNKKVDPTDEDAPLKFKEVKGSDDKVLYYELDPEGTVDTLKTNADGQILVKGLNWWKEYIVKETKVPEGYEQDGATVTATDTPTGEGGKWHDEKNAEYSEIEDLGNGAFRLKIPAVERTISNTTISARVEDPRYVDVNFDVEKIFKSYSKEDWKRQFTFNLKLTDIQPLQGSTGATAAELKALNADIFNKDNPYIATTTITINGNPDPENGGSNNQAFTLPETGSIQLNGEGVYTFEITEVGKQAGSTDPVDYDPSLTRTVTVTVQWSTDQLVATKVYSGNAPAEGAEAAPNNKAIFTNSYDATGWTKIEVMKELLNGTLSDKQFTFELLSGDAQGPKTQIATATNDGTGKVVFSGEGENGLSALKYELKQQDTVFYYYVREVLPEGIIQATNRKDDIVYDTQMIRAKVTLEDKHDKTLEDTVVYQKLVNGVWTDISLAEGKFVTFTNEQLYLLEIQKLVDGRQGDPTRFDFKITLTTKDSEGNDVPYTMPIAATDVIRSDGVTADNVNWALKGNGVYTFKLAHGESIKVYVSANVKYEIEETAPGYSTAIEIGYAKEVSQTPTQPDEYDKIVTDTILVTTGGHTVIFKNTPGVNLPKTGGKGTVPFTAAGLCILGGGIMYAMYLRKKKEREEDLKGSEGF